MPEINLTTNVKVDDPKTFVLELSKLGAELTGHPEQVLQARYTYNEYQSFAGQLDPAYSLEIMDINVAPEITEKHSKAFSEFLHEKLGVSDKRGFIVCKNPGKEYIGYAGSTVAKLIPK